jgi:hypothetical protein
MANVQWLYLKDLKRDGGTQMRVEVDRGAQDDYSALFGEDLAWPAELPPVVAFHDGEHYWLADGHIRCAAAEEAGCIKVRVEVREGTKRDAILFACGANHDHGVRRTRGDKVKAVRRLMADTEWSKWNDAKIAATCKVDRHLVADVRREFFPEQCNRPRQHEQGGKVVSRMPTAPSGTNGATKRSGQQPIPPGVPIKADAPADKPAVPSASNDSSQGVEGPAPATVERPAVASPPGPESGAVAVRDALGVPCPPAASASVFRAEALAPWDAMRRLLAEAQRYADQVAKEPGGELYRMHHAKLQDGKHRSPDVTNAIRELEHWRPYSARCPFCYAKGTPNQATCKVCRGLPYVTKTQFELAEAKLQEAVKGLAVKAIGPDEHRDGQAVVA